MSCSYRSVYVLYIYNIMLQATIRILYHTYVEMSKRVSKIKICNSNEVATTSTGGILLLAAFGFHNTVALGVVNTYVSLALNCVMT